jgi:hypothetical protein
VKCRVVLCGALNEMLSSPLNLVRKPEEERLLGRRRRRWEDNIKMDLPEIV